MNITFRGSGADLPTDVQVKVLCKFGKLKIQDDFSFNYSRCSRALKDMLIKSATPTDMYNFIASLGFDCVVCRDINDGKGVIIE